MSGEIVIRETVPADLAAIVEVHKKGFGYDKEAGLTAELLSDPTAEPTVSLLALRDGEAVGHILFTRCRIAGAEVQQPLFYILAPLAVVPSCQKQGVVGLVPVAGNPKHVDIIGLQILQDFLHMIRIQIKLRKEVADLLVLQNILFLLGHYQKLF